MLNMAEGLDRLGALATSPIMARLGAAFAEAGFELAVVGGPVRDALLGRTTNDLDLTTNARPDDILRIVKPLATATWDIGRAFGTIGARIPGPAGTSEQVEITTYRADSYDGVTRKPTVAFGDRLEDDLTRRDFTVGAMALRLPVPALVDPTGGVEDLVAGILRTPGDPDVSFGDDPLRMLRAARFASQLDFTVAADTLDAIARLRATIGIVSPERVQAELVKLLATDDPVPGIRILVDTGLMAEFLPEVPALRLEVDEHHHHKDVYEHSLTVLQQAIDLHRAIERQRRPGGGGSHRLLRPVRARDEAHVAGEPADAAVALDPQQAPGGVADRDDNPGIRLGEQQRADHVHRAGQRVGAAVGLQLRLGEFQRRQRLGAHEARERPAPRILHERADVLQPGIIGVAADELFVRALDQQA